MFWGGSSYVSDKIFGQNERQSWAFGNLRGDNDFADVTLACEDDQQVEAHKVISAGKVLFYWLFHSHHHINVIVEKQARGSSWALMVKPAGPRMAEILFLSGCWAAGVELSGCWAAGIELSSVFLFRLLNFNQVRYFLPRLLVFWSRTVLSEYCTLSSI